MPEPYSVRRRDGFATSIDRGDWTALHLDMGTVRNEENVERVVAELNATAELRAALRDLAEWVQGCAARGGWTEPECLRRAKALLHYTRGAEAKV